MSPPLQDPGGAVEDSGVLSVPGARETDEEEWGGGDRVVGGAKGGWECKGGDLYQTYTRTHKNG